MKNFSHLEMLISSRLNRIPQLKFVIKIIYTMPFRFLGRFFKKSNSLAPLVEIGENNAESFFGYYDLWPENSSGYVLCHQSHHPTRLVPVPRKPLEVCLFSPTSLTKPIIKVKTSAYNWQQGSRLQWLSDTKFIFNDFDEIKNRYIARIFEINSKEEVCRIDMPIQTRVSENYFLSINYSRLARLRPDYGYFNLPKKDCDLKDLTNDGIWIVNISNNTCRLLYTLADIVKTQSVPSEKGVNHKINHLMLSPDGEKFVFIHRTFKGNRRTGRLMLGDVNGYEMRTLPGEEMVSHYCWVNEKALLCYMRTLNGGDGYYTVNIESGTTELLSEINDLLPGDGHPSFLNEDLFLTDTYPDRFGYQKLLVGDYKKQKITEIASLYHGQIFKGEMRCDLHPNVTFERDCCYFDSVKSGRRRLYRISLPCEQ